MGTELIFFDVCGEIRLEKKKSSFVSIYYGGS